MKPFLVISNKKLTADTFCIRTERPNYEIRAGQCFNVGVPGMGINREYSMYSSADAPFLEFLIRNVQDGLVSARLEKLIAGDMVEIDGPYGEFCMPDDYQNKNFVFIASGTGIAPFHAFVKTYPDLKYQILHGVRREDEVYGVEDYRKGAYISCISKPENGAGFRVTDYIKKYPPLKNSYVYICGNRNMIVDSVEILLQQGFSGDQIITEVFF